MLVSNGSLTVECFYPQPTLATRRERAKRATLDGASRATLPPGGIESTSTATASSSRQRPELTGRAGKVDVDA
ncbi:MAG: hypothetical protein KC731_23480, partial [Myxococcales bacterium]|nr:hypothetical protein [Myxococcales bacterium]